MSKQEFNPPIPTGWETYTLGFKVSSVEHRLEFAKVAFENNDNPDAIIQPEPDNQRDKHAIQVLIPKKGSFFGLFKFNTDFHIGYIPRQLAELIHEYDLQHILRARLRKLYVSADSSMTIIIDLMGPSRLYLDEIKKDIDECEF